MAQDEKRFSHITVTPDTVSDEDDEFVIEAGVRAARAGVRAASDDAGVHSARPASEQEPGGKLKNGVGAGAKAKDAAKRDAVRDASDADERDGYRPTTVDDLKGASMSTMQKAIIGIALAGIIAAVVYYFAVMA